jgi:hypothetical protein
MCAFCYRPILHDASERLPEVCARYSNRTRRCHFPERPARFTRAITTLQRLPGATGSSLLPSAPHHIQNPSHCRAKPDRLPSTHPIETTAALDKHPPSGSSCRGVSDTVLGDLGSVTHGRPEFCVFLYYATLNAGLSSGRDFRRSYSCVVKIFAWPSHS